MLLLCYDALRRALPIGQRKAATPCVVLAVPGRAVEQMPQLSMRPDGGL